MRRAGATTRRRWSAPLGRPLAGIGTVLLLAAGLLLPAVYNGFPLLFSDSSYYYFQTIRVQQDLPPYRTILYSLWLAATWPALPRNLLAGIVAQALLLAALLWQVARTLFPAVSWYRLAGGALLLLVCTAAPWVTSQAMPDVFAPITVLALYLMVTQWQRLTRTGRLVVTFALVVGVGTHVTHMVLAAVLLLAFAIVAARRTWRRALARGRGGKRCGRDARLSQRRRHDTHRFGRFEHTLLASDTHAS